MARSYPSKRFPGGPYIEPQVQPALRGPKRTGPIGEIVPGDDVEVARALARKGPPAKRESIFYHIKLQGDGLTSVSLEVGDGAFIFTCTEDMEIVNLIGVELYCTTAAGVGGSDVVVSIDNLTQAEAEGVANWDMLSVPIQIDKETYHSKDSTVEYEIDLEKNTVYWGDRLSINYDVVDADVRGLSIHLYFR